MPPKNIDVYIEDRSYPGHPARQQQFINIQTGDIVPMERIKGATIADSFIDSFGRMCMTLTLNHNK